MFRCSTKPQSGAGQRRSTARRCDQAHSQHQQYGALPARLQAHSPRSQGRFKNLPGPHPPTTFEGHFDKGSSQVSVMPRRTHVARAYSHCASGLPSRGQLRQRRRAPTPIQGPPGQILPPSVRRRSNGGFEGGNAPSRPQMACRQDIRSTFRAAVPTNPETPREERGRRSLNRAPMARSPLPKPGTRCGCQTQ